MKNVCSFKEGNLRPFGRILRKLTIFKKRYPPSGNTPKTKRNVGERSMVTQTSCVDNTRKREVKNVRYALQNVKKVWILAFLSKNYSSKVKGVKEDETVYQSGS